MAKATKQAGTSRQKTVLSAGFCYQSAIFKQVSL
jgi:hypothetical protein